MNSRRESSFTMVDVICNRNSKCPDLLGPVYGYIVAYKAPLEFPRKFIYNGCSYLRANGNPCATSVDGSSRCSHNSRAEGFVEPMYRFDVLVVDQSGAPPLFCHIFQAAATWLGMSAEEFQSLSSKQQMTVVHEATINLEQVKMWISCKQDKGLQTWTPIIQEFSSTVRKDSGRTSRLKKTPTTPRNRGSSSQVKVKAPDSPGSPEFFSPRCGSPINATGSQSGINRTGSQSAGSSHTGRRGPLNSYRDLSPQKARLLMPFFL
jgi:hypothetical protein